MTLRVLILEELEAIPGLGERVASMAEVVVKNHMLDEAVIIMLR